MNARADRSHDVLGQRSEIAAHFSHSFFDNAFDRAAPTGMEHSDSSLPGINKNHGQAIGRLDGEENSGHAGD
jgi:hypothetical protein